MFHRGLSAPPTLSPATGQTSVNVQAQHEIDSDYKSELSSSAGDYDFMMDRQLDHPTS